jgi:hypothetical protein
MRRKSRAISLPIGSAGEKESRQIMKRFNAFPGDAHPPLKETDERTGIDQHWFHLHFRKASTWPVLVLGFGVRLG